jgi:predicted O-methyltransferase YrrM
MDAGLLAFLDELWRMGEEHDAGEPEHARRMLNITPDTGRFLWILARSRRATSVLEIGTSNGYSTIWLADAVRDAGGRVVTLERSAEKIALARANLERAGVAGCVEILEGDAHESLRALKGSFDLVFLDADRSSYLAYLEAVLPLLPSGGLLVADNVLSHADELAGYLDRVKSHPQLLSVTLPVGKGEELSLRL